VTIGSSVVIAQGLVAGYSQLTGSGVSNQSVIFLSAILAGAGTDYAVFLISRYHDYLRVGADFDHAVKAAMISIGKVITASATTVGITFLVMSFAQMGVFKTVGVSAAIGIGVAFLAGVARLGEAEARADGEVLAAFGDPHRASSGPASGREPARAGPPGRLRGLRSFQLRRSQGGGGLGTEFGRLRRTRATLPDQSVCPAIHPGPVAA
jgi:hypothetical protein